MVGANGRVLCLAWMIYLPASKAASHSIQPSCIGSDLLSSGATRDAEAFDVSFHDFGFPLPLQEFHQENTYPNPSVDEAFGCKACE